MLHGKLHKDQINANMKEFKEKEKNDFSSNNCD